MSGHWVRWGDAIWPRILCEPFPEDYKPGVCVHCGGMGAVPELLDSEHYPEMVACHFCRVFCKPCGKYVPKVGHECKAR